MANNNFAESWKDLYKQYIGTVNFVAGDYETLKDAIRQYIVNQIPENYTDFADSSEVAMFSNSIAYLGENLHQRIDFSVHNLFPQTTEKKQALLDFVKMLSYFPTRNICALGLGKIVSVSTNEDIEDSVGISLVNQTITWNDAANENWQEQFLTVINAALSANNQFGNPRKTDTIDGVITQVYQMNNEVNSQCCFPFTAAINSSRLSFNVVYPDIDLENASLYEQVPSPESSFQLIYRNDGSGNASINTGFYVMWKQGSLINLPQKILEKKQNNRISLTQQNINSTDVWFTELDTTTGLTTNVWTQVDNDEYLAYNTRSTEDKNLYKVETKNNDSIDIVFGDGNFSNIPYGTYNLWIRTSAGNEDLYIKPDNIQNVVVTIPYKSLNTKDTTTYNLTLVFSVADFSHIRQSSPSESMTTIKNAAPLVYSTQDRMVSNVDYNRYPLVAGDKLVVLKSLLRTYAGNSRYIKLTDNTGTYTGLNIVGKDGYVYGHIVTTSLTTPITNEDEATKFIKGILIPKMNRIEMSSLYYDMYDGQMIPESPTADSYEWRPSEIMGGTIVSGMFYRDDEIIPYSSINGVISIGDSLCFETTNTEGEKEILWVTVQGLSQITSGDTYSLSISPTPDLEKVWHLRHGRGSNWSKMYKFGTSLETIQQNLINKFLSPGETFGITFDPLFNGGWRESTDVSDEIKMVDVNEANANDRMKVLNWFFRFTYNNPTQQWTIESREKYYAFGSEGETSFYFNTTEIDDDGYFGTRDYVTVLNMNKEYTWKPYDSFVYQDGFINPTKFKAKAYDNVNSLNAINPLQFKEMISEKEDKMIFEKDTNYKVGEQIDFVDRNIETEYLANSYNGTMWGYTDKSGYYYTKYKCMIYPAGTELPKQIWQPITHGSFIHMSNNTTQMFVGGRWNAGTTYDYDIVDYIESYSGTGNTPGYYGEEGYIYDYNAKTHELTDMDKNDYIVENGVKNLKFLWVHYPNEKQVIDPCTTNIVDMYALTRSYYLEVKNWISNGKVDAFPTAPTSYEIESSMAGIEDKKMMSDTIVWHPVIYKLVFGYGSASRNKCIFKVVKLNNLVSDNEVKQLVIQLIDSYFETLSVGETFYFTKMASYIHAKSNGIINSIYPTTATNTDEFGALFEIGCEDNELLLSTATIDNVQIISTINSETVR